MDSFEELLQKEHLKRTKARVMILRVLEGSAPITAADVYEAVRNKDTKLSLSTVYRNCEALAEKGILSRSTMMSDGLIRYEYAHGNDVYHAICLACGKIFSVDIVPLPDYKKQLAIKQDFEVTSQHIEFYGFCKDCKGREKEN